MLSLSWLGHQSWFDVPVAVLGLRPEAVRQLLQMKGDEMPVQLWHLFVLESWMKAEGF